jgi:hypothetical protein
MSSTDRLSRPRLVALWQRVMPGATVLVTAQHKSGVASSVREWLDGSGKKLVVWSSNRLEVPENAPDADVVLLEVEGMRTDHATATLAVREHWPNATLIAISSTQWPPELLDAGLRPERVFAGALFGFTADEVLDRAEQLGFSLAWDEATALLERVGTHAGFVDAVLRAAAARGSLDEEAVRAGCHEQAAYFGGSAAAGVFRPNGWYAALVTARIGPMPRRTLLRVWGRDEVVRAALDNIMQSGFFVEDLVSDTIELRPAIRAAIIERITREAQLDSVDEAIVELATKLLDEGNPGDGWAIVADLPGPRARLLTRYWWHLGEVDVERARPWLEQAVQRDPEPALRVALARALVSVTSAGHSGSVPAADRQAARDLLEEVGEQPGGVGVAATLLRGVLLRLDGRYREALELHEELANTGIRRRRSDDAAHEHVAPGGPQRAGRLSTRRRGRPPLGRGFPRPRRRTRQARALRARAHALHRSRRRADGVGVPGAARQPRRCAGPLAAHARSGRALERALRGRSRRDARRARGLRHHR